MRNLAAVNITTAIVERARGSRGWRQSESRAIRGVLAAHNEAQVQVTGHCVRLAEAAVGP